MKIISILFLIGSIYFLFLAISEISKDRSSEYGTTKAIVQNIYFNTQQVETSRNDIGIVQVSNTTTQYEVMVNYTYNVNGSNYKGTFKSITVYSNQEAENEKNKILNNPSLVNFNIYYKKNNPSESSTTFSVNNSKTYFITFGVFLLFSIVFFFAKVSPYWKEEMVLRNYGPRIKIVNNRYTNKYLN
jgi:hypothetical protein